MVPAMTKSPTSSSFMDRLAKNLGGLTDGQRLIANRLLVEPAAAFTSAERLAREVNVSVPTTVRFAQALGYAGYGEMRQALVTEARETRGKQARFLQTPTGALQTLEEVLRRDIANMELTFRQVESRSLEEAVKALAKARHRVILGRGISCHMAGVLAYLLTQVGLTSVADQSVDFATQVSQLSAKDLLVAFSFHPYSRETLDAVTYARKRHVPILGFTDRPDAPLAKLADWAFPLYGENLLYSHSLAGFMLMANSLAVLAASKDAAKNLRRLKETERISQPLYLSEE
jgi:DNA-binding MurR/RpiR family transcriptional regulator